VFEYHASREAKNVNKTLENFKGYLQMDGYAGSDPIRKKANVKRVECMAQIRRKFDEAKDIDLLHAQKALTYIQAL
jgi:transposase